MSRRNHSTRRRSYGRRQHEVRERPPGLQSDEPWLSDGELESATDWHAADNGDEGAAYRESFRGFAP